MQGPEMDDPKHWSYWIHNITVCETPRAWWLKDNQNNLFLIRDCDTREEAARVVVRMYKMGEITA